MVACPYCSSEEVLKNGTRSCKAEKRQVYLCKPCGKSFSQNTTYSGMRFKGRLVKIALELYFNKLSLRQIRDYLYRNENTKVSHVTILHWVRKYSKLLKEYGNQFKVNNGDTLHADEMMVNVNGKWRWYFIAEDKKTRFALASDISKGRDLTDTKRLFRHANSRLNNVPERVVTDGMQSYRKAFKKVFGKRGSKIVHEKLVSIGEKPNNNVIERLNGTIRERTKVMRGFDRFDSAGIILGGQIFNYNFVRPHSSLNGLTPAQAAGIDLPLGNDRLHDLIKLAVEWKNNEGRIAQ